MSKEMNEDLLVNEFTDGTAVIVEVAVYNPKDMTASTIFYVKRDIEPDRLIKIPESSSKCMEELKDLMGKGKISVNIDEKSWDEQLKAGAAQRREFIVAQTSFPQVVS